MAASAMAVSTTLRLHQEEATGRAEPTLAGAVDRSRWLGSHLAMALGGSGIALLAAGAVAGLTYGVVSGDVGGKAGTVLGKTFARVELHLDGRSWQLNRLLLVEQSGDEKEIIFSRVQRNVPIPASIFNL